MTTAIKETTSSVSRKLGAYDVVRVLLGLLLLAAAGMKGYSLATGPVAEQDLLTSRWFLIIGVEVEFVLGVLLLIGLWKRPMWFAALLCFSLFTFLAAYKIYRGESSCGCFGRVSVDPRYILTLDILAILALAAFRPLPRAHHNHDWKKIGLIGVFLLSLGIMSGWTMGTYKPTVVEANGDLIGQGSLIVLEPEKWIGKNLPLFDFIDIGDELKKGEWIVVFYHADCHTCQEAVPKYQRLARELAGANSKKRIAFVEMPPFARPSQNLMDSRIPASYGTLSATKEWFTTTPLAMTLAEGKVSAIAEGTKASLFVDDHSN
jgi:hypothetical protein